MSAQPNEESLLVGITLKGKEIKRFLKFKEDGRHRTNAAAGYALVLDGLDAAESKQAEAEPALAR